MILLFVFLVCIITDIYTMEHLDVPKESSSGSSSPRKKHKYFGRIELPKESSSGSTSPHSSPKKNKNILHLEIPKVSSSKSSESPLSSPKEKSVHLDLSSIESSSPVLLPKEKLVHLDTLRTEPSSGSKYKYFSSSTGSINVSSKRSSKRLSGEIDISSKATRKISKPTKQLFSSIEKKQASLVEQELLKAIIDNDTIRIQSILHPNMNIVDPFGKTPLIISIQNSNDIIVKELIEQQDIDVNKTDAWGNTPLHHAAIRGNEIIIKLLLHDYRIDSLLKNKSNDFAHQLIGSESSVNTSLLKVLIFVRFALDSQVKKQALAVRFAMEIKNDDSTAVDRAVNDVKKSILKDYDNQKDYEPLPEDAKLPDYANDEFIKKMILYRIKCEKDAVESQKVAIHVNEL